MKNSPPGSALTVTGLGILNVLHCNVIIGEVGFDHRLPGSGKFGTYSAIWDTGASSSVITPKVVSELGLVSIGKTQVHGVNSITLSDECLVNLVLPSQVGIPALRVTVNNVAGVDALIGMDVINAGDFHISNFQGKTVMTFRMPSHDTVDYVKDGQKYQQIKNSSPRQGLQRKPPHPGRRGKK